jgi:hypothetical protein
VRSIKYIAPAVINFRNYSAGSNKGNPKRHFKEHVGGPAIVPVVANDQNLVRGGAEGPP